MKAICTACGRDHRDPKPWTPDDALGGCPLKDLEDDCESLVLDKPTLRCRLLGCEPAVATWLDDPPVPCGCGKRAFTVGLYLRVHENSCRRCGRPIIPTARIAR